jgi:hypothetical protein
MGAELRAALASAETQFPALAAAPAVLREGLLFPYLEGAGYVLEIWRDGAARGAGLGERLPVSTEQVLSPGRAWGAAADLPTELEIDVDGAEVLHADGLGQAEIRVLLRELTDDPTAVATGWDGDRYALVAGRAGGGEGGVGPDAAEAIGLVWVTVWDDSDARDAFVAGLAGGLGRLPRPATLEAADVEGRPGAVLRVGWDGAVEVAIAGGRP